MTTHIRPVFGTYARVAAAILLLALLMGCGRTTTAGYWEGKGKAREVSMKDRFREMTRSADFEFWFVLDKEGNATGEIELNYDSKLTVENLPSVSLGIVSFNPKVGGKVTDLNPKRKFPLVGVLKDDQLTLEIATPEADRPPIDFTIRADPGVSAGFGLGAGSITVPGGAAGVGGGDVIKIPMKPFSPFNGSGKVEKRPSGPYAASFDARGSNWAIEWSARQMGGEQREVKITPEMQQALDKLRQQAGKEPPESKAKPKEPAPKEPLPSERKFKPGEWEKLSPEEQKAFVDQYMKERNIPRLPTDTNDHHVWPKYLGGPEDGPLETLDERLHQLFHAGLDRVLPRTAKGGQEYYASLSEAQKIENIKSLLRYTRDFDVTYGTKVYEKLLQALKGSQYEALPGTL